MKFSLEIFSREFGISFGRKLATPPRRSARGYNAAAINRLTSDWLATNTSADSELQTNHVRLRDRSREHERNNDYVRRYLKLVENNVLGAYGIGFQMKSKDANGALDTQVNDIIEAAWYKWGKRRYCSLNQRYSWRRVEGLSLRSAVRDGAVLVRLIDNPENPYGLTLQPLEIDHLDHDYNKLFPNGNEIRAGVEMDINGRIVRYHIFETHPGDNFQPRRRRIAVDASNMLYIHLPERIAQTLSSPWMVSAMVRLQMLSGYEEAELVAAREGACKGGFITSATSQEFTGDAVDSAGNQILDMEPGVIRQLDPGQEFVEHDPKHPNTAYNDFIKGVLRGLSSGLGVSYNSLANDLEGVNYSSIRAGLLEEREEWKAIQCWLIEELHEPIFERWLEMALISGALKTPSGAALPVSRFDKFNMPEWKPRRWDWVDPEKDINASIKAIGARLKSRREVIAEAGGDIEAVDTDFENDPVTSDLDSESVYTPDSQPEPPKPLTPAQK
jgi:lambda family phage portal protein